MDAGIVVLVLLSMPAISIQVCPNWGTVPQCYNEDRNCASSSIWEEDADVCGVCGGCREYLGVCDTCDATDPALPPCQPGYTCNAKKLCFPQANTCYAKKHNPCTNWSPACVKGEYAPRQCKGVKALGRCFCVDPKGNRIFGEDEWAKAENMTCACSRRVEELKATRKDVTLHCSKQGNYETLQCDDGLCWCADEKTGVATSRILPENMMTMLYCYNETEVGAQYLRICESKLIAQSKVEIEMNYHGTYNPHFPLLGCDRDGTYSAVQTNNNQLQCVWKDNAPLGYASEFSGLAKMNCRCARDKKQYPDIQLVCEGNGKLYGNTVYEQRYSV